MKNEFGEYPDQKPATVSKGCWIAAAIVLVVAILGATGMFALWGLKVSHSDELKHREMAEAHGHYDHDQVVAIRWEELDDFSPTDFGESLSIENAIAILVDSQSTKLARDAFTKAADGHEVDWQLKVSEISKSKDDEILAELEIPYEIRTGHSAHGSSVNVTALFSVDDYPRLVSFRQGEWIRVRGLLKIRGRELEILDPELVIADSGEPEGN